MKKEFPLFLSIIIVLALVLTAFVGRFFYSKTIEPTATTYEECVAQGNLVMDSYPEQCRTQDGRSFTRELTEEEKKNILPPGEESRIRGGEVFGHVTIGPLCPVMMDGDDCPTPALVFTSRKAVLYAKNKTTVVREVQLSPEGTYSLSAPEGSYYVEIVPAGIGRGEQKPVIITSGYRAEVNFDIDTGIR